MRTKARRGMITVPVALLMTALVAASAISIDMSRLQMLRHELQFSADAGAHAGAIQLMAPNDPSYTVDTAAAYSMRYMAMEGVVQVDSVELGGWDELADVFVPGASPTNAVRVVVSQRAEGFLMSRLGEKSPRVHAHAVAWFRWGPVEPGQRVVLAP